MAIADEFESLHNHMVEDDDALFAMYQAHQAGEILPNAEDEWRIHNDAQAARWGRRLGRIRRRQADVKATALAERTRINEWERRRTETLAAQESWALTVLEGYARAVNRDNGSKTLDLPSVTLRLRSAPPRVEADDAEALHEVAPSLVRTSYAVDKAEVKARLAPVPDPAAVLEEDPNGTLSRHELIDPSSGEVVPGVSLLIDTRLRFTAKEDES